MYVTSTLMDRKRYALIRLEIFKGISFKFCRRGFPLPSSKIKRQVK